MKTLEELKDLIRNRMKPFNDRMISSDTYIRKIDDEYAEIRVNRAIGVIVMRDDYIKIIDCLTTQPESTEGMDLVSYNGANCNCRWFNDCMEDIRRYNPELLDSFDPSSYTVREGAEPLEPILLAAYDRGEITKIPLDTVVYESHITGPLPIIVRDWNQRFISCTIGIRFFRNISDAERTIEKILNHTYTVQDAMDSGVKEGNPFFIHPLKRHNDDNNNEGSE